MLLPASRQITMKQKTSKLTTRLPAPLKEDFKIYAAKNGKSMQEILILMLEEELYGDAPTSIDKNFCID